MSNYNFSTLNDKEFEQIAKDLLNAKYKLELQDFKVGKDKGVDLRYSTIKNNNSIIVQAKHYIGSAFAQLKYTLLTKELTKVQKLNPDRYIVVTSLSLSAAQKDELKIGLSPFVLTSNDIIGQEDLNSYLGEYKEIEKNYFKLWFSSITVFNSIINNAIEGRTKYLLESIKKKIPFYVVTKKLDDANKILQKEKLLLITGQPGIGKTTLAEIILFERAKNGYKIYEVENITEAEDVVSPNDEEKQLFYFDDFLGANYFEIVNAHKTETQLTAFVERIKATPNKYLILTTRTVILNHAIEKYEKIGHSKLANQQFEIKLTDFTNYEKALILYNHIYFRSVREDLHNIILYEKFYKRIIHHKNYTPRIIEFITDSSRIEKLTPTTYLQFILNNLNNPKEIWRYSYNNQIGYLDRCLLLTLFTFASSSFESSLNKAFEKRLEYEKDAHNQVVDGNQFQESVKILLNGFITSNLYNSVPPVREFTFINPSLTDFLIGHVSNSFPERKSIISSMAYIEQLNRFNPEKKLIPLEKELQYIIRDQISKSKMLILEADNKYFTKNREHAILMETLSQYCYEVNIDSLILFHFNQISFTESWSNILTKIENVLINLDDAPQTYNYIKENFIKIIEKMMNTISDSDSARKIPILFEKYHQNYDEYTESDEGFQNLISVIESVLQSNEDDLKSEKKDEVKILDEVVDAYYDLYSLEKELKNELFPNTYFDYDFQIDMDKAYWEEKIEENLMREERNNAMDEDYGYYKEARFEAISEENAVDDLFIKQE
ncbi:MAG: restriction endonuclease [Bacteroidales bacterium]|nr:restriction endonuclease [Bacteroidales bacterium]